MKKFNLTKYDTPAIGWGILVLVMSLLPSSDIPNSLLQVNDKLIHFAIYFIFVVLLILGRTHFGQADGHPRAWSKLLIFGVVYGGLIELIQGMVSTHRSPEWGDMFANLLGACCGFLLFTLPIFSKSKKTE